MHVGGIRNTLALYDSSAVFVPRIRELRLDIGLAVPLGLTLIRTLAAQVRAEGGFRLDRKGVSYRIELEAD
jgi:hypothetical protein